MATEVIFTPQVLCSALEEISTNFAYKMLFLEIKLSEEQKVNTNKSVDISELTSLYMKAVQSMQGRFQQGFIFFHNKIQNLMKKRSVVEELFKSVNSSLSHSKKTMMVISKAQVQQRREEYDLRKSLQQDSFDHNKVKQMIKNAQLKINMIESRIKTGIFTQEEILNDRIKLRRKRSVKSINGEGELKNFKKRTTTQNIEEDFGNSQDIVSPVKKSEKRLLHFNSFSSEIKI